MACILLIGLGGAESNEVLSAKETVSLHVAFVFVHVFVSMLDRRTK